MVPSTRSCRWATWTRLAFSAPWRGARSARNSTSSSQRADGERWSGGDGRPSNLRYSAAAVGLTFDTLAEVALARDLLRRWYGLELGLASGDGSSYERTSHDTCEMIRKHP